MYANNPQNLKHLSPESAWRGGNNMGILWNFINPTELEIKLPNGESIIIKGNLQRDNYTFLANPAGIDAYRGLSFNEKQELKMFITDRSVNERVRIVFEN